MIDKIDATKFIYAFRKHVKLSIMRNFKAVIALTSLILFNSCSNSMLITKRDQTRIKIAQSLENWKKGNKELAMKLANESCNEGNGNGCALEISYLTEMYSNNDPQYVAIPEVKRMFDLADRACNLKQPLGCAMLSSISSYIGNVNFFQSLIKNPLILGTYIEDEINKCVNNGGNEQECKTKVNNEVIDMNALLTNIQKYEQNEDQYRKMFCKYGSEYNPSAIYGVTERQKRMYESFINTLKDRVSKFRIQYCSANSMQ